MELNPERRRRLTGPLPDPVGLVLRGHKDEVDGDPGEDHGQADGGLHGGDDHGQAGDHDGGQDVEDREDQVDLDGSLPLGVLPAEVGDAEDRQADGDLSSEAGCWGMC